MKIAVMALAIDLPAKDKHEYGVKPTASLSYQNGDNVVHVPTVTFEVLSKKDLVVYVTRLAELLWDESEKPAP